MLLSRSRPQLELGNLWGGPAWAFGASQQLAGGIAFLSTLLTQYYFDLEFPELLIFNSLLKAGIITSLHAGFLQYRSLPPLLVPVMRTRQLWLEQLRQLPPSCASAGLTAHARGHNADNGLVH